jgi:hypothetical protein
MMPDRRFTAEEKLECLRRELRERRRVYKRKVQAGKMSPVFADEQIALMTAIVEEYEQIAQKERLI